MGTPEYELHAEGENRRFKTSHYTHLFPFTEEMDRYIMFNAFNQATFLLPQEHLVQVRAVLNEGTFDSHAADPEVFRLLSDGRFIVPEELEEKELMRSRIKKGRQATELLFLTIAPTMGCNFNCSYCFEDESFRKDFSGLSKDAEGQIVALVKHHIQVTGIKQLSISWFGGEPLTKIDIIEGLSARLKSLCDSYKVGYSANITTNGYLLNEHAIAVLAKYNTSYVKISIDGPPAVHDKRRMLLSGKPTYQRIFDNAIKASSKVPVLIRINVDKSNYKVILELLNIIAAVKTSTKKISVYLGIVEEHEFITDKFKTHMARRDFSETDFNFIIEASKRKLATWHLPSMIGNFCGADLDMGYMIGPLGELYACWADFGDHNKIIGYLGEEHLRNERLKLDYTEFDVTQQDKCGSCTVMPLCTGGCSRERVFHNEPQCGVYKFNLAGRISEYVSQYRNSRQTFRWKYVGISAIA